MLGYCKGWLLGFGADDLQVKALGFCADGLQVKTC
jgi:hypothetical protein